MADDETWDHGEKGKGEGKKGQGLPRALMASSAPIFGGHNKRDLTEIKRKREENLMIFGGGS